MRATVSTRKVSLDSADEIDNADASTARLRKSSDSLYSSEGSSSTSRADVDKSTKTDASKAADSSDEDELSQLKTKSTARSKRARRLPDASSQSSGDDSAASRKLSDSQYSSDEFCKDKSSKRRAASSSKQSDTSRVQTRSMKGKKAREPSSSAGVDTRKKKKELKRRSSEGISSLDEADCSQPRTSKRRKKAKPLSPISIDDTDDSQSNKKLSGASDTEDVSCSSDETDSSQSQTDKVRKRKKVKQLSPMSDESQNKTEPSKKSDSEAPSSTDQSDNSQPQTTRGKRRKETKQLSAPSSEEASDSEYSSTSNSETSTLPDESEGSEVQTKWSSDSDGDAEISEESVSSQKKKSRTTPKKSRKSKRKNVRGFVLSLGEDEKKKESPDESPKKIVNLDLLNYKYSKLKMSVKLKNKHEVRDIIYGNYEDLALPEFAELLWAAVNNNAPEIASMLVRANVDVNLGGLEDNEDNTVLHVVAEQAWRKGYENLAFQLMSHGAYINCQNGQGNSVLWSAVKGGSVQVVEELLRRQVDIEDDYNRVLRVAAESERNPASILPLLVEYKAPDMETKDRRAMHALRCLVRAGGDLAAMKVLLECILPLNDLDDEGSTLLHRAVVDSKYQMVKLLLEYGADPRNKRRDGTPPLSLAVRQPTSAIAGLLIKHGASVHDCNAQGQYPIHGACNVQSAENIRLLLHFGAEVNVTDNYLSMTPFSTINHQDLKDATKLIIQQFAILKSRDSNAIEKRDIIRIREYPVLRIYYAQCMNELERMKRLKIFEDISVYSILNYDLKKISHLIKNSELIDEYYKNKEKINKFSVYSPAVHRLMKLAWTRRDKLNTIENAIREASNNVLPDDVCEKIAYLACHESFIDIDLKEIASS